MRLVCFSASNAFYKPSISDEVCKYIADIASDVDAAYHTRIIKLREWAIEPCIDCGQCFETRRCPHDELFNQLYEIIVHSDAVFIVSPHYAPIPARLCMLLEKMEEVAFLRFAKDNSYQAEVHGIPCGVISHGGTGESWAEKVYKAAVNDPIANALDTIQLALVPYDDEWRTGIVIPAQDIKDAGGDVLAREKAVASVTERLRPYVEKVLNARR